MPVPMLCFRRRAFFLYLLYKYLRKFARKILNNNIDRNFADLQESTDIILNIKGIDFVKEGFLMSRKDELKDVIASAQKMIAAPSCYAGLREKAQIWIDSIDTDKESKAAKDLIEETKADITGIDDLVAFAHSDHAVEIFGKEGAKGFAAHADELKKSGAKYCDCPACVAGLEILKHEDLILK